MLESQAKHRILRLVYLSRYSIYTLIQSTYLIPSRLIMFQHLEYQSLNLDQSTYPINNRLTKLSVEFTVDWTV